MPTATSWWDAPRAEVPESLRERGDNTPRGRITPIPDRTRERTLLERRRAEERARRERADYELLDQPIIDGRTVSAGALRRLQEIVGRALVQLGTRAAAIERTDGPVVCRIERTRGRHTRVHTPGGTWTILNLTLTVRAAGAIGATNSPEALRSAV